jgi:uncharacterized phiE125 gp8 family phage protein
MLRQLNLSLAPWTTSPLGPEPLTLVEAKAYLKIEPGETADDDLITAQIQEARAWLETFTNRALITQTWKLTLQEFPRVDVLHNPFAELVLEKGKGQTIVTVSYTDTDGVTQTLTVVDDYQVDFNDDAGARLRPTYDGTWPSVRPTIDPVRITWTVGYGDTSADIPSQLLSAMKWKLADLHENRADDDSKQVVAEMMASPYRIDRL